MKDDITGVVIAVLVVGIVMSILSVTYFRHQENLLKAIDKCIEKTGKVTECTLMSK
jgi:hypothetical protein